MARHNEIGAIGEKAAANHLKRLGFTIVVINYQKKWGEIDIIAKKAQKVHFVEVKSVSHETKSDLERSVSHGTFRPEQNVHPKKLQRLHRTIETWLLETNWAGDWQLDVACVRMVPSEKYATISIFEDVV